jgi:CBS domain containing-hemolysin-like protein
VTTDAAIIALAVVLVALAGLLTMAETAISRVSRSKVEEARKDGDPRAARLLTMLDDRPRYVNVLLFLSTVAMTTATVVVGYVCIDGPLADSAGSALWGVLVAVLIMVVASYVVVGVAGRTLGRQHAYRIAMSSARAARGLAAVLGPLATLLILIGNAVTPGKGYREGPFATQAELREMVDLAEADDLIEDDERQMIHSALELGDTFAREVMVPRTDIVFIDRTKTLRQALSLGLRSGYSRIPVIGENADDVVGIMYLKDVVRRVFEHRDAEQDERVESLMRVPYFVPDSKPADALLRDMQSARVHMAIVVDEYGGTAGLATIEDILEEIVGEITDEYDTQTPEVTEVPGGAYRVLARMHVDDCAELLGMEIDSEDEGIETVLGFVAKRLGRVPIPGSSVDVDGWRLTAEQGADRRNRIGTVLAQRIGPLTDAEGNADAATATDPVDA